MVLDEIPMVSCATGISISNCCTQSSEFNKGDGCKDGHFPLQEPGNDGVYTCGVKQIGLPRETHEMSHGAELYDKQVSNISFARQIERVILARAAILPLLRIAAIRNALRASCAEVYPLYQDNSAEYSVEPGAELTNASQSGRPADLRAAEMRPRGYRIGA